MSFIFIPSLYLSVFAFLSPGEFVAGRTKGGARREETRESTSTRRDPLSLPSGFLLTSPHSLRCLQIVTSVQLATKFVDSEGKPGNLDPDSRAILTPQLGEFRSSLSLSSLSPLPLIYPFRAQLIRCSFSGESYMPLKTQRILLFFGGGSPTSPDIRRFVRSFVPLLPSFAPPCFLSFFVPPPYPLLDHSLRFFSLATSAADTQPSSLHPTPTHPPTQTPSNTPPRRSLPNININEDRFYPGWEGVA